MGIGLVQQRSTATGAYKRSPARPQAAEAACDSSALLVLVYLRKSETFDELAAGFGAGTTTAWRYVNQTVALLAGPAPARNPGKQEAAGEPEPGNRAGT